MAPLERGLSNRGGTEEIHGPARADRISGLQLRRNSFRAAWHWQRRVEGAGHGSSDGGSVQSIDSHEQFYDWRDGGGQRGNLFSPRIRGSGAGHARHVGSALRRIYRSTHPARRHDEISTRVVQRGDCGAGNRDAGKRTLRKTINGGSEKSVE